MALEVRREHLFVRTQNVCSQGRDEMDSFLFFVFTYIRIPDRRDHGMNSNTLLPILRTAAVVISFSLSSSHCHCPMDTRASVRLSFSPKSTFRCNLASFVTTTLKTCSTES